VALFIATMVVVALVTAVLNLDTSVVFMTPVAIQVARKKGTDETAFIYGTIFVSNSSSLLLLGSNLTNLLVFANRGVTGTSFVAHMALPWLASTSVTIAVVLAWRWRFLRDERHAPSKGRTPFALGPGAVGAAIAVVAMVALSRPALWVLSVGVLCELVGPLARRRSTVFDAVKATSPLTLLVLFVVAVGVGSLARATSVSANLLVHANVPTTVAVATVASVVINNLPSASLFAAHAIAHPFALLLGLDVGPNVAVTGALSSLLWILIAKRHGFSPSLRTFSLVGTTVALSASTLAAIALAVH
jgi:arsenical pump membrane protein